MKNKHSMTVSRTLQRNIGLINKNTREILKPENKKAASRAAF